MQQIAKWNKNMEKKVSFIRSSQLICFSFSSSSSSSSIERQLRSIARPWHVWALLCCPGKWFLLIYIQIFLCLAPYSGFYSYWIVLGIVVGSLNFRLVPKKCLGFCLGLGLRLGDGIGMGLRSGMESYRLLQAAHRLLSHIQVAQPVCKFVIKPSEINTFSLNIWFLDF